MKFLCPKASFKSETHGNATLSDFLVVEVCVCRGGGGR